jgi:RHS repeat-associated protein
LIKLRTESASPVTYYVHTDHLARPIRMTNSAKAEVWTATWTPWGTAHELSGTAIQNLRFPGQYFLMESGLHYNWHRLYDPTLGRYTQPDPLGFPDGPARYAYAGNSPLMRVDPDGRDVAISFGTPLWGSLVGDNGFNPFGHLGLGVTGQGAFSLGTGTRPGSSFTDYLKNQSSYRSSMVFNISTTPEQDICIANAMRAADNTPLAPIGVGAYCDNCASRAADALRSCGIDVPKGICLPGEMLLWLSTRSGSSGIPVTSSGPGNNFTSYDPKPNE